MPGFAPGARTGKTKRRSALDERSFDRPRSPAEAPPGRGALRRDGPCQVVEHEGPARQTRCRCASSWLPADALLRAGPFRLRRRRSPLRGGVRAPQLRHALAFARDHRGGVRRSLGALARQRERLDGVLSEARSAPIDRPRGDAASIRGGRRTRRRDVLSPPSLSGGACGAVAGRVLRYERRGGTPRSRVCSRRTRSVGRPLRAKGRRMMATARANVASSFTLIKGAMIDETYAVFAAWDFARSKRENLDRLRDQNFIGASSATWLRDVAKVETISGKRGVSIALGAIVRRCG